MNTENGYQLKSYNDNLNELLLKIKDNFGEVQITSGSALGTLTAIFAEIFTVYETDLAYSMAQTNVLSAEGIYLDSFAFMMGISRKTNTPSLSFVNAVITEAPAVTVPTGTIFTDSVSGQQWFTLQQVTVTNTVTPISIQIQSVNTGAIDADIGDITITTFSNLEITNPSKPQLGEEEESDTKFRRRIIETGSLRTIGLLYGLQVSLLNLTNVLNVKIYNNIETTEDPNEIPPKSFETVVYGGYAEDIVAIIQANRDIVARTWGTESINYYDPLLNQTFIIYYSRALLIDLHIQITATINNQYTEFEKNRAINSVVTYINSTNIGDVINNNKTVNACYKDANDNDSIILGFDKIVIGFSRTDSDYVTDNFILAHTELAKTSSSIIVFQEQSQDILKKIK